MKVGPGSLKCVIVPGGAAPELEAVMGDHVRAEDIRRLDATALLVYTNAATSDIRDWLRDALPDGASVLVTEFETWSCHGSQIDRAWLRDRGH